MQRIVTIAAEELEQFHKSFKNGFNLFRIFYRSFSILKRFAFDKWSLDVIPSISKPFQMQQ